MSNGHRMYFIYKIHTNADSTKANSSWIAKITEMVYIYILANRKHKGVWKRYRDQNIALQATALLYFVL